MYTERNVVHLKLNISLIINYILSVPRVFIFFVDSLTTIIVWTKYSQIKG